AFGGRILPGRPASGEPPPKYLNSPESPVFRKGHTLYGLALARDAIRKADLGIVDDGYLDVIALAQAGLGEVVARRGPALAAGPPVGACVGELAGAKGDAVGRHAEAAREVARLLKRVREPHEFDVLARLAAQRLGVREETLRSEGAPGVAPAAAADEPHAPGAEATLVELMAEDATLAERVAACGIIAEFQH